MTITEVETIERVDIPLLLEEKHGWKKWRITFYCLDNLDIEYSFILDWNKQKDVLYVIGIYEKSLIQVEATCLYCIRNVDNFYSYCSVFNNKELKVKFFNYIKKKNRLFFVSTFTNKTKIIIH